MFFCPPPFMRGAAPGGGYSFTMTAGDGAGGVIAGYDTGSFGVFGEIDAEPLPGFVLGAFFSGAFSLIGFIGNAVSLLAGKTVWVNGVQYPFTTDWAYNSESDVTNGLWSSGAPVLVNTNVYFVEIK